MKKTNHLFLKIISLCALATIPTLTLVACGAPSSNKYLTSVSQFNNLFEKPNEENSEQIQVNYSLLVRSSQQQAVKAQWSYKGETNKEVKKPLNNEVDSLFQNIYGSLVNGIAYNIARPAATFATTISGYNKQLSDEKKINLFTTDQAGQDADLINQFYQAMANNLNVANNQSNVSFGVSDLSFKFKLVDSTTGNAINTGGNDTKGTIDARSNNTEFKNTNNEIVWPYDSLEDQKNNKPNSDKTGQNVESANRLTKLVAVTDINVIFRFFISGADQGSAVPSRNEIVTTKDEKRKAILDERWLKTFKTPLNTYAFQLKMQDMIGIMRYSVSDAKKDDKDVFSYNLSPVVVQSLMPMAFYNNDSFDLTVSQQKQENSLKINKDLLAIVADKSKILHKESKDENVKPEGPTYADLVSYGTSLNLQSAAFINQINKQRPDDITNLKNLVLQAKPDGEQNYKDNVLNFTIEDYYKVYFGMLTAVNDSLPFAQDITIDNAS